MRYLFCLFLFFLGVTSTDLHAKEPFLEDFRGTYFFSWNGIPVAKLWFAVEQEGDDYTFTSTLKSSGVVRIFKKIKAYTKSHGVRTEHGWQTLDYHTSSKASDGEKLVEFTFKPDGTLMKRTVSDEDDPNYRKPIPEDMLKAVQTYGSAFLELRRLSFEAIEQGKDQFETKLYDGKRLMGITAEVEKGGAGQAHVIKMSRRQLAGFTEKERKRFKEGEPYAFLHISNDEYFVPVKLEVMIKYGLFQGVFEIEKTP